jgi:hypothetical protein
VSAAHQVHSQYRWLCGLFEGKGVSTSRVSPLSISYGHVGCLTDGAYVFAVLQIIIVFQNKDGSYSGMSVERSPFLAV